MTSILVLFAAVLVAGDGGHGGPGRGGDGGGRAPPPPPKGGDSSGISNDDVVFTDAQRCLAQIEKDCDSAFRAMSVNATMACLTTNFVELEATCTATLSAKAMSLAKACQWDIISHCSEWILDPMRAGVCLFENYGLVSVGCRREIDYTAGLLVPCGKEAGDLCADKTTIDDLKTCLKTNAQTVTEHCTQAITDFEQCQVDPSKSCFPSAYSHPPDGEKGGGKDDGKDTSQSSSNGGPDGRGPPRGPNPLVFLARKYFFL